MKIFGLEFSRYERPKFSNKHILVDTGTRAAYSSNSYKYEVCHAKEFDTKEQALKYLDEDIAKSKQGDFRLFIEVNKYSRSEL